MQHLQGGIGRAEKGLEQKLTLCTWEVWDVLLQVRRAKGCVGSTFAKLGIFETRVNLFIMPWETRSERFAGFLQHPGPEGFTFLVPVCALVACLHFIFSSVSLFHTPCVFLDPPVAFTHSSLTVLVFHLVALSSMSHLMKLMKQVCAVAFRIAPCCLLGGGGDSSVVWEEQDPVTLPYGFCCPCFPPLLHDPLCCRLTHGNGLSARSDRCWLGGNPASLPLLPCAELPIKPIRAMAGGCSSKMGIREKFQHVFELTVKFSLSYVPFASSPPMVKLFPNHVCLKFLPFLAISESFTGIKLFPLA